MTIDSFSLDKIFNGKIIAIDPAETVVQGVIYYKTTVQFDQNYPDIKSGMTANMDILASTKENVLMVSPQAVQYRDNKPFVRVLENNKPVEKKVTLGLEGNQKIEITGGLNSGEQVILYETTNGK
jgi:multidrug efflux pump subunit AcrA (membrane-fusion protein)